MTNDEKLQWLNDMNAHISRGGKLEFEFSAGWAPVKGYPAWGANPTHWRKVPLPRKETRTFYYWWDKDNDLIWTVCEPGLPPNGFKYYTKEVEFEEPK